MSLFDLTADTNSRKLMTLNPEFPKDVETTVIKGNTTSATFSVEIAEHGKPAEYTYQWYVNDTPVEGATKATYERTDLSETETLSIYCEVTNKKGTIRSRTATLKVTQYFLPALNGSYPQDITTERGTSVTCKAEIATAGNPNSYTYQWYKNGSAVSGATSSSYTFAPSATGKTTVFCKVTNSAGTVTTRTATITAIYTAVPGTFFDSIAVNNDNSKLYRQSDGSWRVYGKNGCTFKKAIDVSNYTTMTLVGSKGAFKGQARIGLFSSSSIGDSKFITGFVYTTHSDESFNKTYDISSISGTVYLAIYAHHSDADTQNFYATIRSIVFKE